jgi:hypothetical protein
MNRIFIPATKPEDWRPFLASPTHWKKGHSAMSLACCWHEALGLPMSVSSVFRQSDYGLFKNVELVAAFPEYKVSLPGGKAASQNDLFVLAKGNDQLISIMVEGKVSENFGMLVSEWLIDASPGKIKRLAYLCSVLGLTVDSVQGIRYQLLHRAASAVIESGNFSSPNAMLLIHSFSPTDEWFDNYAQFAALFRIKAKKNFVHLAGRIGDIDLYLAWIKGEEKYLKTDSIEQRLVGKITTRKCESCGHHEVGVATESGEYISLKPGMSVEIYE